MYSQFYLCGGCGLLVGWRDCLHLTHQPTHERSIVAWQRSTAHTHTHTKKLIELAHTSPSEREVTSPGECGVGRGLLGCPLPEQVGDPVPSDGLQGLQRVLGPLHMVPDQVLESLAALLVGTHRPPLPLEETLTGVGWKISWNVVIVEWGWKFIKTLMLGKRVVLSY